ncbi:MAG: methyltransferase domain-containing protein [Rhizobiaceae bacterium]|nr:methyltransferase domain-containing protein [Rhizobiaceae bacterium]
MQPIVDSGLILQRRLRALRAGAPDADFLVRRVADDLADRLAAVQRRFEAPATLFSWSPAAAAAIAASGRAAAADRVEADPTFLPGGEGVVSGLDRVPLAPASRDLVVSLLSLQDANDIPGLLAQIRRSLKPDGLFLGALAGAGTLGELRESLLAAETEIAGGASPRVMPFTDVRDAGALLQRAGFALPVADIDTVTVRYATMFDLMRDLRAMGATNAMVDRSRRPATRRFFTRAAELYAERFAGPDGRIPATFNIVWLSGWAPHESQQKPLKPGSATTSLAKALRGDG